MGSASSKLVQKSFKDSSCRYPTRAPAPSDFAAKSNQASVDTTSFAGKAQEQSYQVSGRRSSAIDLDGRDPQLAASLRRIGPVQPNPTLSNSSNVLEDVQRAGFPPSKSPTILALQARQRIQKAVEEERASISEIASVGRRYLDVATLYRILALRDEQCMSKQEIERILNLKEGVVSRLGSRGLIEMG